MLIGLIRHGATNYNLEGLLQGWKNIPLNNLGIRQAKKIAKQIGKNSKWNIIYCSDLLRAKQTAQIISRLCDISFISSKSLRERFWGNLEGKKIGNRYSEDDMETIEPKDEFEQRVVTFFEQQILCKNINILIVSHEGVLKCISKYMNLDISNFNNAEIYEVDISLWKEKIVFNETV